MPTQWLESWARLANTDSIVIWVVGFLVVDLLVSSFACWRGGAPERIAGVLFLLAGSATAFAPIVPRATLQDVYWLVFYIDLLLLGGLLLVALFADRFWPVWLVALQLIGLASHGVRSYDHDLLPVVYVWMITKLSYPMLAILLVATHRHLRRTALRPEFSWTFRRRRADEHALAGTGKTDRIR